MSTQASLPTFDKMRSSISTDVDVKVVAGKWLESFAEHVKSADITSLVDLFVEGAFFKDILALTWEFRTFEGKPAIKKFLEDRLPEVNPTSFRLQDEYLGLQRPSPDMAWIQGLFQFETNVGLGSGVFRLVPMTDGEWKAHTMFTNLEDLKGFSEKTGILRDYEPRYGNWEEMRKRESEFEDAEPTVLIVGGGQSGLGLAARLKNLDVMSLVVEKQPRVGDQWRKRYETLCLHDPVCELSGLSAGIQSTNEFTGFDHMPYIPLVSCFAASTSVDSVCLAAFHHRGPYIRLRRK